MSDEKEACHLRFKQLFTQADIDNDGVINGRDAAEFFRRLHLPDGFLKKVCVLSDVKRQGSLSEAEFYTSLQLIFLCRLDFASSSDEGYIQDWKEILQLLTQHGVIFPVPPPREKMIKIFEETVVKHGIVTGAQVRAIFGRSSLRQDLFSSLCDMFGMSETKIVDDDLFIRFGLAVQLLLHATAMARRARSNSKAAGSGFSTPGGHGATTPGRTPGSVTPGAQWSRPTAPSGSVTARVAVSSDSLSNGVAKGGPSPRDRSSSLGGGLAPAPELQGTIGRKMADLQLKDDQVQQAQNDVRSAQQSNAQMEQEVKKLNSQLEAKKMQYDQLMEQTKQLQEATVELSHDKLETEALYRTLADHAAQAEADLEKAKAVHSHELNKSLAEAKLALRERDVQLAKLRESQSSRQGAAAVPPIANWQQAAPVPQQSDLHSINGLAHAEQIIQEASNAFGAPQGDWANQPAQQGGDWAPFPDQSAGQGRRDSGSVDSTQAMQIPVLEEQHTGGSTIASRTYTMAPSLGPTPGNVDFSDNSENNSIVSYNTGVSNPYSDWGTETPRPDFVPPGVMAQLGSSISINIDTITLKGIRRLNKPFVSVCVVDAEGRLLAAEQATPALSGSSTDLDSFAINKQFEVPIPDDGALAASCAMIFKLRHLQKRTGAAVSRCWAPLELRDILHQSGTQNVSVGLYQKPTDLKRKRMNLEGKQSKLVIQVTAPDIFGEGTEGDDFAQFPGDATEGAAAEEVRRQPTAEEAERAVELFNEKPKRGLQYLTDNGFIRPPPHNLDDIVKFLMTSEGMSKAQIGQYLGTRGELPEAVLSHFVYSLDFVNKKFDDCVRMYFREFFPPGEADPIYRMMEKFGEHFASVNEGLFESDDAPLVLAYAVLMLNTDLHNTAITSKITQDQFIHNLRGCNKGNDISREFLAEIYTRISKNEIKMKDQDEEFRGGRPAGTSWRPAVIKTLTEGAEFKKYGRAGNPHDRWVYVTADLQHVCYSSKFGKASNDQMIPVSNITKLIKGMETPVFERQIDAEQKAKLEKRCFSLDAGARTLDVQAKGEIECKQFYDAYRFLVQGYLTD